MPPRKTDWKAEDVEVVFLMAIIDELNGTVNWGNVAATMNNKLALGVTKEGCRSVSTTLLNPDNLFKVSISSHVSCVHITPGSFWANLIYPFLPL